MAHCPTSANAARLTNTETAPTVTTNTASAEGAATATWVLVVEDDEGTRAVIGSALEDAGYVVAEASDGLGALEVLKVSPYSMVVLLDYWMPRVGGEKVIEAVMADATLAARHRFVLVTATPEILPPNFARQLAALDVPVVAKPFDMDTLLNTVLKVAARLRPTA